MAGFKVQCPACDAPVPIRDEGLIGRKIDCPKCKKRFLVEEPPEEAPAAEEEAEAPAKKSKSAVVAKDKITAAKKAAAAQAKGKAPAKGKPGPKEKPTAEGEAEEGAGEDGKPAKKKDKKKKGSMLVIGGSLAVAAVAALGVAVWALFLRDSDPPNPKPKSGGPQANRPGGPGGANSNPKSGQNPNPGGGDKKIEPAALAGADISNLLPNDSQVVGLLAVDRVIPSSIRLPLLNTPGSFKSKDFQNTFGFPFEDISRIVFSSNGKGSHFAVVRTARPFKQADVLAHLKIKAAEVPINALNYYLLKNDLDCLSNLLFKANMRRETLALHFVDPQTLVLTDQPAMKTFLEAGGRPKLHQAKADPAPPAPPPMPDPKGGQPMPDPKGGKPAPDPKGANPPPPPPPPQVKGAWLSVKAELKSVLDQIDQPEKQATFCIAGDYAAMTNFVPLLREQMRADGLTALGVTLKQAEPVMPMISRATSVYGYGLRRLKENRLEAIHAVELNNDEAIKEAKAVLAALNAPPMTQPPNPQNPPTPPTPPKDPAVKLELEDRVLTMTINQSLREEEYNRCLASLRSLLIYLRGEAEMINTQPKLGELARATQKYLEEKGHFPPGTLTRPDSSDQILPVPPQKRLSWMVELLKYLGDGEYKDIQVRLDKSWQEGENLILARLVIPQFVVRGPGNIPPYRIVYPGTSKPVAATHFVGIAGVGMNAPYYDPKNPAEAKKVGIFGYDRVTKKEDIKDGLDQTIALIQVPLDHKAPWIAGGGSTVRGVLEELDCFKPFICAEYLGQKGTFAIMADGKVRFLSETIPPETFRAMCTINGGEKVENLDTLAPEVQGLEAPSELKTLPQVPAPKAAETPAKPSTPAKPAQDTTSPKAPEKGNPPPPKPKGAAG